MTDVMSEPAGLEGINGGDGDAIVSLSDIDAPWFHAVVAKARADLDATPTHLLPAWARQQRLGGVAKPPVNGNRRYETTEEFLTSLESDDD